MAVSPLAGEADHGAAQVQSELGEKLSPSGEEQDSAEPVEGALGSAASVGLLLGGSGLRQKLVEEGVLAVEVLELEEEH